MANICVGKLAKRLQQGGKTKMEGSTTRSQSRLRPAFVHKRIQSYRSKREKGEQWFMSDLIRWKDIQNRSLRKLFVLESSWESCLLLTALTLVHNVHRLRLIRRLPRPKLWLPSQAEKNPLSPVRACLSIYQWPTTLFWIRPPLLLYIKNALV